MRCGAGSIIQTDTEWCHTVEGELEASAQQHRQYCQNIDRMIPTEASRAQVLARVLLVMGPALSWIAALFRRAWVPRCRIIVVIGSHGKTTATHVVAHALDRDTDAHLNGNILALVALRLMRLRRGTARAVFEVGIGVRGQMGAFARMLRPDVVIVTSIGSEHQNNLGSPEDIRAEKAIMVEALRPEGLAVLNSDDSNVMWMKSRTNARITACGSRPDSDIRADDVSLTYPPGMSLRVSFSTSEFELRSPLVGHTMVFPLLAAVAVAREEGVSESDLQQRLATATPVERRMAPVPLPNQSWGVVDDRKSLPETVAAALNTLDAIPAQRKWVVLGELGMPPDHPIESLYRTTGAALGRVCDLLVLTTPDPEKRDLLVSGATSSGLAQECITSTAGNLQSAADHLTRHLEPGDLVLFKGRFPERLVRIALALEGVEVRCWVPRCGARLLECRTCPALTRP